MDVSTIIVVSDGMVSEIFSSIPSVKHTIEVLNFDTAKQESQEASDALEKRLAEFSESSEFHTINF